MIISDIISTSQAMNYQIILKLAQIIFTWLYSGKKERRVNCRRLEQIKDKEKNNEKWENNEIYRNEIQNIETHQSK